MLGSSCLLKPPGPRGPESACISEGNRPGNRAFIKGGHRGRIEADDKTPLKYKKLLEIRGRGN